MSDSITMTEDPNPSGLCLCGCGSKTTVIGDHGADGYRKGWHRRYLRGHWAIKSPQPYIVDPETGCWVWQRASSWDGYGKLLVPGTGRKTSSHRYMYEKYVGPIPEGMQIDHLCRNRACCNPNHLEVVTPMENFRRGSKRRLTEDQVREIRRRVRVGETQTAVAKDYGVCLATVNHIMTGRNYSTVPDAEVCDES